MARFVIKCGKNQETYDRSDPHHESGRRAVAHELCSLVVRQHLPEPDAILRVCLGDEPIYMVAAAYYYKWHHGGAQYDYDAVLRLLGSRQLGDDALLEGQCKKYTTRLPARKLWDLVQEVELAARRHPPARSLSSHTAASGRTKDELLPDGQADFEIDCQQIDELHPQEMRIVSGVATEGQADSDPNSRTTMSDSDYDDVPYSRGEQSRHSSSSGKRPSRHSPSVAADSVRLEAERARIAAEQASRDAKEARNITVQESKRAVQSVTRSLQAELQQRIPAPSTLLIGSVCIIVLTALCVPIAEHVAAQPFSPFSRQQTVQAGTADEPQAPAPQPDPVVTRELILKTIAEALENAAEKPQPATEIPQKTAETIGRIATGMQKLQTDFKLLDDRVKGLQHDAELLQRVDKGLKQLAGLASQDSLDKVPQAVLTGLADNEAIQSLASTQNVDAVAARVTAIETALQQLQRSLHVAPADELPVVLFLMDEGRNADEYGFEELKVALRQALTESLRLSQYRQYGVLGNSGETTRQALSLKERTDAEQSFVSDSILKITPNAAEVANSYVGIRSALGKLGIADVGKRQKRLVYITYQKSDAQAAVQSPADWKTLEERARAEDIQIWVIQLHHAQDVAAPQLVRLASQTNGQFAIVHGGVVAEELPQRRIQRSVAALYLTLGLPAPIARIGQ